MNPLCVCFETTSVTDLGQKNLDNLSKMGMDVVHFKKNSEVYKKMVVESFKRVGDEMWPNHIGIFTIPIMFAVKFNIPLIIWGENPQQEYGGPNIDSVKNRVLNRKWLEEFGGLLGNRIQDIVGVNGITRTDTASTARDTAALAPLFQKTSLCTLSTIAGIAPDYC
jgi:hypothetical protein